MKTFARLKSVAQAEVSGYTASATNLPSYPNGSDNALYLSKITLCEGNGQAYRGFMPGVYATPQFLPNAVWVNRQLLTGPGAFANKYVCYVFGGANNGGLNMAGHFFDVTGPWR